MNFPQMVMGYTVQVRQMNYLAASNGVSSFLLWRRYVLAPESSRVYWIPAFAGMTNSQQAAGNETR
jgi:hypothetical protein